MQMRFHTGFLVVAVAGSTAALAARTPATLAPPESAGERGEETRIVFAALFCAYDDVRAKAKPTQVSQLDDEIAHLREMFRMMNVRPRPCSDPLIGRLAGCIHVWFGEADEILSEWRADAECSSEDVASYK